MRRFVCVAALLFGFSGDRYAWTARLRTPAPIVQPVRLRSTAGTVREPAWWLAWMPTRPRRDGRRWAALASIAASCSPREARSAGRPGAGRGAGPMSSSPRAPRTTSDPALQSDIASAAFSAQVFESLTAFDLQLILRRLLAASWDVPDDGCRIFYLRPGLTFDGAPITAGDVAGSWLRIIDPSSRRSWRRQSSTHGATEYLAGRSPDPATVGER